MSQATISKEQVKKIAELVKLILTEEQTEKLTIMFSNTLKTIEVLDELDIKDVGETYQVTGLVNVFLDPQKNLATLTKEEALSNAKEVIRGLIATQAVFERG